jgi:hypothetical protein
VTGQSRELENLENGMMGIRLLWTLLALTYAAFFFWYTSFGGPLSEEEISRYMRLFEARADTADPETLAVLRAFMETDTGDDFVMVNLIDLYETPVQVEGVVPGESSSQVLDRYMSYMYPALFKRACHPVLFGSAAGRAMDLMNADGMERWSAAAGMRYRSRRDMLDIAANPAFTGSHEFKVAAMRKTIAFPVDPWFQLGDPRLLFALLLGLLGTGLSWLLGSSRSPHRPAKVRT